MDTSATGLIAGDDRNSFPGERMFDIVLSPSDVGGPLVVPKENAEKHFPAITGGGGFLLLPFIDSAGKTWLFRYSYSGGHFVFTDNWDRFVVEKKLFPGDTVSFWREPMKDYVSQIRVAHQVFDEMSAPKEDKELMFEVVLTPSDVSGEWLVIPREPFEKHFPVISPDLGSCSSKLSHHYLSFIDPTGKSWRFKYEHRRSSDDFIISRNWRQFMNKKQLVAGNTVSFLRARKKKEGKGDVFSYYIDYNKCSEKGDVKPFSNDSCLDISKPSSSLYDSCLTFESDAYLDPVLDDVQQSPEFFGSRGFDFNGKPQLPRALWRSHHRALLYCNLFPDDYEFEKDTLIQLWIAGTLFEEEPLEYFGEQYFEDFLVLHYIHFSRNDLVTGKALYKFQTNNLSELVSRETHFMIDGNSNLSDVPSDVSHVSLRGCSPVDSKDLDGFKRFKKLRTLLFLRGHRCSFKQVPRDFFMSLKRLQFLDLSRTDISELPSSIANVKWLSYLDISHTPIKRLPETIDCLSDLQTLKLNGCSNLYSLPKGMRKLINLRHLELDVGRQLQSMPLGIGSLTRLRTLSAFLIGGEEEEECSIRQLKNMNNLTGSFCISRLENVSSAKEAIEACLSDKQYLRKLELRWSDSQDEDVVGDNGVLFSLKPNARLEELVIHCYNGSELPSWICDPSFSKLVSISLFKCENCLILPSLGQLPSLKVLSMVELNKVKTIDDHLCVENVINKGYIAFPMLEKLTIEFMFSLEEWKEMGRSQFPSLRKLMLKHCPKLLCFPAISSLCCLEHLEIIHCPMLASFPDRQLPNLLDTLIIEGCPTISARFLKDETQDWPNIAHVPNVWIDLQEIALGQRSLLVGT